MIPKLKDSPSVNSGFSPYLGSNYLTGPATLTRMIQPQGYKDFP